MSSITRLRAAVLSGARAIALALCTAFAGVEPAAAQDVRGVWIKPASQPGVSTSAPAWIWATGPAGTSNGATQSIPTTAGAPVGPVWLCRVFDSPAELDATLTFAADNDATVYLNGLEIVRARDWSTPARGRARLAKGTNTLAIAAENSKGAGVNPAGVIGLLESVPSGATPAVQIVTDGAWTGSSTKWPAFPAAPGASETRGAVVLGPIGSQPWTLSPAAFAPPQPCPILRRSFTLPSAAATAKVRVVGLGHYELRVNGRVAGDTLIHQAWSQYDKRIFSQEFDLAPLLHPGENVIALSLGNSFWRVDTPNDAARFCKTDAMPDFSDGQPYLVWIEGAARCADGTTIPLTSDKNWKSAPGPLTFSHIYAGEDFDARRELKGWDLPGFDDTSWRAAELARAPAAEITPLASPGMKVFEVFDPTEIKEVPAQAGGPPSYTYVFPANCSALLRFTVRGDAGQTVRFKQCEYMEPSGRVKFTYTWGTGKAIWHDYTLRGGDPESHQTLFCFVGAQYVEVTGAVPAGKPNPHNLPVLESLRLAEVRAANREIGSFSCSSDLQNAAHRLIDRSVKSNMAHVFTDCPHREKNGWQEQNWHMARAVSYSYDLRDYFRKLNLDVRDTQLPDGHVPTNCPRYLVGIGPHGFWNEAPEWGVASVLVPWHLYEWYADRDALADAFDSMKRFTDYLSSTAKDDVITSNLGDWYDYGHGQGDGPSKWTPAEVSATIIWAIAADTVSRAANVLGKPDDAARYHALFERVRASFLAKFWDPATATVKNGGSCQAGTAAALCAGLVPQDARDSAVAAIVADLEKRGYQQTTGEVLHVFLIRALAENGRGDVLHKIYAREDRGSYGYMVRSGLTSLPESWDAKPGTGNSLNHFMLGHLVEWQYAYVAGIRRQPGSIGWDKPLIAPQPGPLTSASATFDSPRGPISSQWSRRDGQFELTVSVPVPAVAILPDGTRHALSPGKTTLRCPLETR
jgi:hypothetical protein